MARETAVWLRAIERAWPAPVEGDTRADAQSPRDVLEGLRVRIRTGLIERDLRPAINTVAQRVDKTVADSLRLRGITTRSLSKNVDFFRAQNVDLISSLAGEELDTIGDMLDVADRQGVRVEVLRERLMERFGVSEAKADLLARDQTLKLAAQINQEQQQAAGVERYRWSSSRDERTRERHADLDGTEHSWDDPPEVDGSGRTAHPGEDYQCRCVAVPIVPWLDDEG